MRVAAQEKAEARGFEGYAWAQHLLGASRRGSGQATDFKASGLGQSRMLQVPATPLRVSQAAYPLARLEPASASCANRR